MPRILFGPDSHAGMVACGCRIDCGTRIWMRRVQFVFGWEQPRIVIAPSDSMDTGSCGVACAVVAGGRQRVWRRLVCSIVPL